MVYFDYFTARSNFVAQDFIWKKEVQTMYFSEFIAACDIKVGIGSERNE